MRFLVAVTMLATAVVASACGGSPTRPSAPPVAPPVTAPPTTVPVASLSMLSSEAQEFVRATNLSPYGAVTRFAPRVPVKVWGDPWYAESDVAAATKFWADLTSDGLTFVMVKTEGEAQIPLLHQSSSAVSDAACGSGGTGRIDRNVIMTGSVALAVGLKPVCMNLDWWVSVGLAHEIGHAIGLQGHHTTHDVMSATTSSTLVASSVLREVVSWLYAQEPGARPE